MIKKIYLKIRVFSIKEQLDMVSRNLKFFDNKTITFCAVDFGNIVFHLRNKEEFKNGEIVCKYFDLQLTKKYKNIYDKIINSELMESLTEEDIIIIDWETENMEIKKVDLIFKKENNKWNIK